MKILGFDWDANNHPKVEAHDLTTGDVEEVFERGCPVFVRHPDHTHRWYALGFVPDGRFVVVVFEYDAETHWVRVVTAYEPTSDAYWRIYVQKRGC